LHATSPWPPIDYVVLTAGSVDVMVEVVCEGDSHLLEILGKIRAIPSVRATETFVYLKLHKADVLMGHPVTAPA
jgi:Lrp/AsnC family transcriptional regulator for asnA, asnC and gidA